jgi:hypothetical protein
LHTNSTRQVPSTSSTTNNTNIPYIERIKRPSTLVKPVSILNKSSIINHESPHPKNQVQFQQVKINNSRPKPILQKTNNQIIDDDNNDEHFPPPPPIPRHHNKNDQNMTLLKDYEEPIHINNKMQANVNVKLFSQTNVNSKMTNNGIYSKVNNSNLFFNVEEEFKKKVK